MSIVINLLLTFFQVVGGFFAHSQALMAERLGDPGLLDNRVVFHYLDSKVDAEIYLAASQQAGQADALQARCDELVRDDELFRAIHVHRSHAQN